MITNENKIQKSDRCMTQFAETIGKAMNGEYDIDLQDARDNGSLVGTSQRLPLLKIHERFVLVPHFSLETATEYYKLYKEKFYIENPGSSYFETCDSQRVYRKVVAQHEEGDKEWAERLAEAMTIDIQEQAAEFATEEA